MANECQLFKKYTRIQYVVNLLNKTIALYFLHVFKVRMNFFYSRYSINYTTLTILRVYLTLIFIICDRYADLILDKFVLLWLIWDKLKYIIAYLNFPFVVWWP